MAEAQRETALPGSRAPNFKDTGTMLRETSPDVVAVSNENDLKATVLLEALEAGCDLIVDKPLCIQDDEQDRIEELLRRRPQRRLLNLLTLRGDPPWVALRSKLAGGEIGTPAFLHVRMAVRLKRAQRPPWFLDVRRSGGMFLDLLIHGLDQVEWLTGARITAMTAGTGNLGDPAETHLRDHASVFCELDNGATAMVEGQRMLPDTAGSDYRVLAAGTGGFADLIATPPEVRITNSERVATPIESLPARQSIVEDWLAGGDVVPQHASLRSNRLALLATRSADQRERVTVPGEEGTA
jgi:predicted dehydrogenase